MRRREPQVHRQSIVVEAGELVGVQTHRPGLQREVGSGLPDVVEGVVAGGGSVVGRPGADVGRSDEDDCRPRHPTGVASAQPRHEQVVVRRAALAHEEGPRLGVARRRRPLRCGQQLVDLGPGQRVRVVEHARAPPRSQWLGQPLGAGLRSPEDRGGMKRRAGHGPKYRAGASDQVCGSLPRGTTREDHFS